MGNPQIRIAKSEQVQNTKWRGNDEGPNQAAFGDGAGPKSGKKKNR
jgi:hypothetical protein